MPTHDLDIQNSGAIVVDGTTLAGVMAGVHREVSQSISGAVGALDFSGATVKRFLLTGDITGSFTFPPQNIPSIATNGYRLILLVELEQDNVGGRMMNLSTLFTNAGAIDGVNAPNMAPNAITQVLLVAQRAADVISYTAYLPISIDGAQIVSGIIPVTRIQDASTTQKGVIQIGTGSGGAAAGNHIHIQPETLPFRIRRSDGGTLVNSTESLIADISYSGSIVRIAKVHLEGDAAATASFELRIDTSPVTGCSGALSDTPSADFTAISANTFNERQAFNVVLSGITGTPKELIGVLHILKSGIPTA